MKAILAILLLIPAVLFAQEEPVMLRLVSFEETKLTLSASDAEGYALDPVSIDRASLSESQNAVIDGATAWLASQLEDGQVIDSAILIEPASGSLQASFSARKGSGRKVVVFSGNDAPPEISGPLIALWNDLQAQIQPPIE